jgi:hypothetical protein
MVDWLGRVEQADVTVWHVATCSSRTFLGGDTKSLVDPLERHICSRRKTLVFEINLFILANTVGRRGWCGRR